MDLDAQVRDRLRKRFISGNAPCCSHEQFGRLVEWVAEIAAEAESGRLRAERLIGPCGSCGAAPTLRAEEPQPVAAQP